MWIYVFNSASIYLEVELLGPMGFAGGTGVIKPPVNAGDARGVGSIPGSERSTPVFLSGKFYG